MEQLKPCPFCGSKARVNIFGNEYQISCDNCCCDVLPNTWLYFTEEEVIEAWNTRRGEIG